MEESRWLQAIVGGPVLLKCENLQRTGSFKIRGAYVRISRLSAEERARGVVAASAGNHAQGVALAAQLLGISATVFMPEGAPIPKANATRGYGAEVRFHGEYLTQALVAAQEFADETGAVFIHPFDHADIVAGQGTLRPRGARAGARGGDRAGADRRRRAAGRDRAGDQGRASRRTRGRACRPRRPRPTPSRCAPARPVALERMSTMADGIAVAWPGDVPFAAIQEHVDEVVTVSEESISRALVLLLERAKMVVEPSGRRRGRRRAGPTRTAFETPIVAVLSGGNVDPLLLGNLIRHGLTSGGRYLNIGCVIPDRPGGLARLLAELADSGANVLEVAHERTSDHAAHRRGRGARSSWRRAAPTTPRPCSRGCASTATGSSTDPVGGAQPA